MPTPLARTAHQWGFAIYRASHNDYQDLCLPPATRSAPPRKPSTLPAASTSAIRQHGSEPNELTATTSVARMEVVLGIDIGTSSTKGLLVTLKVR